jgi:outer membrane protein assembly factor BamA
MKKLVLSAMLSCLALHGQDTRADAVEAARAQREQDLEPPEEPGLEKAMVRAQDSLIYRLLTSTEGFGIGFGQMVPGAGFSAGGRYQRSLLEGHLQLGATARGSDKKYYLGRFYASAQGLNGHVLLDFSATHSDYPQMPYYGPGPDSRRMGRSDYRLEDTNVELRPAFSPVKGLRIGALGSFKAINVGRGTASQYISADQQYGPPVAPGIQRQTSYLEAGGFVEYDWRDLPGDPTNGGLYRAEYARLSDTEFGTYSFYRLNLEAKQFIPLFNGKRVIALHGQTWLTDTNGTQIVPFYMQPTLGGPDTMRGFEPFRFYDNNAVLLQGEYRWEASTVLDLAAFADEGKVFHDWDQWNLHHLESSVGFGLRIKSLSAVVLRIDTGFSHEGFKVWFRAENPF